MTADERKLLLELATAARFLLATVAKLADRFNMHVDRSVEDGHDRLGRLARTVDDADKARKAQDVAP